MFRGLGEVPVSPESWYGKSQERWVWRSVVHDGPRIAWNCSKKVLDFVTRHGFAVCQGDESEPSVIEVIHDPVSVG